MTARLAATLALALAATTAASVAHADPCGPHGCPVGCRGGYRFGSHWSHASPAVRTSFALAFHVLPTGMRFIGTAPSGAPIYIPGHASGTSGPWLDGVESEVAWHPRPWWYIGGAALGGVAVATPVAPFMAGSDLVSPDGMMVVMNAGPLAGLALDLGPLRARAEVLAAAQLAWIDTPTNVTARVSAQEWSALAEPRAALEWWVTPWLTLGVRGGVDVTTDGIGWTGAVFVGGHARAFDGARHD